MECEFVRVLGADGDARQFERFVWDEKWSDLEISSFIDGRVVRSFVSREKYEEYWTETNADLVVRDIVCFEYMESIGSILGEMSIEGRYKMHIGLVSWLEVLQGLTRIEASVLSSTGGVQVRGLRSPQNAPEGPPLELAVVSARCPFEQIKHMPKWRMSVWQRRVCFANYAEAILIRSRWQAATRMQHFSCEIVRRIVAHLRVLMVPLSTEGLLRAHKITAFRGPTSPCYDSDEEPLCFYDFLRFTWRHLVAS